MSGFGEGPLLAVDAPYLLYRSFFGIPKTVTNNALLGMANTLLAIAEANATRAVVVCFGAESAAYRTAAYPPYHAHRPPMPPELEAQFDLAPALFRAFGWVVESSEDHEADDLIHSFAQVEAEAGGTALIVTGDRDMYQSVNERVTVLMLQKGGAPPARVDPAEVQVRYGIRPEQVPDFIALRGDPSDGLPGAKGIGEKTARDLLQAYGTLEEVVSVGAAKKTASAAVRALPEQLELLRVFRDVATIRRLPVARPADTAIDRAGALEAAKANKLERLARRFEGS